VSSPVRGEELRRGQKEKQRIYDLYQQEKLNADARIFLKRTRRFGKRHAKPAEGDAAGADQAGANRRWSQARVAIEIVLRQFVRREARRQDHGSWVVCALLTLVCPRSHVRRPPPVSHT
jgi:hypothetical protein